MNNIHEKDWASDDNWGGHSGMGNDSDYSNAEDEQTPSKGENDSAQPQAPAQ